MICTDLGITYPLCAVKRVVELNIKTLIIDVLKVTVAFCFFGFFFKISHRKMECSVSCDGHIEKEQSLSFLGTVLSDNSSMCLKYFWCPKIVVRFFKMIAWDGTMTVKVWSNHVTWVTHRTEIHVPRVLPVLALTWEQKQPPWNVTTNLPNLGKPEQCVSCHSSCQDDVASLEGELLGSCGWHSHSFRNVY